MSKKYYWLRLQKDFFKRHDIRILEEQPNGKDYVLFYLKLLLESISHEGQLRFNDTIPYDEKMLSVVTNTNIDVVRSAIMIFQELHLMEIMDDHTIYMNETYKMIGQETKEAERKRNYRAKINQLGTTMGQLRDNVPYSKSIEIDIELEKDIETNKKDNAVIGVRKNNEPPLINKEKNHHSLKKEIIKDLSIKEKNTNKEKESGENKDKGLLRKKEKEKDIFGELENVRLSTEELEKLKTLFPLHYEDYIEQLSSYIASKGDKYKSHYATIRMWLSKNGVKPQEMKTTPEDDDVDITELLKAKYGKD